MANRLLVLEQAAWADGPEWNQRARLNLLSCGAPEQQRPDLSSALFPRQLPSSMLRPGLVAADHIPTLYVNGPSISRMSLHCHLLAHIMVTHLFLEMEQDLFFQGPAAGHPS